MLSDRSKNGLRRRDFLKVAATGSAAVFMGSFLPVEGLADVKDAEKPATNINDALKYPRTPDSMPGKFPARVSEVIHPGVMKDGVPDQLKVDAMLTAAMLSLAAPITDVNKVWRTFFTPEDIIGIKVNPVAGADLSTRPEVVKAIIRQLTDAGIPQKNIIIWDRREFQLKEAGFTPETFPGIKLTGTECQDEKESFYNADGKLYSEERIDKEWFYWADTEEEYDAETLPYMVNQGKYSYYSKICTREVTKIINVPILKNAGSSVTVAMKNLAFGVITNTGRLHSQLWSETCAEVCAFPPVRDKVVLNIVDGLKGCFNGGPSANPQYIREFNTLLAATDPVAVDRVCYDIILKKRMEEGIQKEESAKGRKFLELAAALQLGEADLGKIERNIIQLG